MEYTFPFEKHLRDFIVQNLDTIKFRGKTLNLYVDDNETDGVEYRTGVGIIDVLAVDEEGNFVIFELKLSRGNDATLGQVLRYMGWVETHISNGKKVSGIIVAKSIDEKLKYAVSQIKNVSLFEYEIDFKIEEAKI
ncbi:endonuclease NucS domain-containing protein [Tepidibacter hydrothermalis]|uniref:Endonuclease NucS n=1 Tax=Tepidibacter hydrothermalis TaxID=3036126 RepID=A0ABY8EDB8_9FIRM|nr:endonuclease NucS domain-containing protein [Tepidibacter hydrothermalis]WFD09779.1 endonuclease NucS [Tepidibacter hydrothermalis]